MSIETMPLRAAAPAPAPTADPADVVTSATDTASRPADDVPTATLIAHAVDRAEARLERLRDELDRVRTAPGELDDVEVDEIRLLAAVAEAERERDACSSLTVTTLLGESAGR